MGHKLDNQNFFLNMKIWAILAPLSLKTLNAQLVPNGDVTESPKNLPRLQNDLEETILANSDLTLYNYDEDLVEAPDADDYSSFWYGAASPDDVQGIPSDYDNVYGLQYETYDPVYDSGPSLADYGRSISDLQPDDVFGAMGLADMAGADTQSDSGETVGERVIGNSALYDKINALTGGGAKKKQTGNKTGGKNPNRPNANRPNSNRPKNPNRPTRPTKKPKKTTTL